MLSFFIKYNRDFLRPYIHAYTLLQYVIAYLKLFSSTYLLHAILILFFATTWENDKYCACSIL